MRNCHYEDCDIEFEPTTHNQVYHTPECCRLATNKRIMERYYERKEKRAGKHRTCAACEAILSRYNDGELCASCTRDRKHDESLASLLDTTLAWG